MTERERNVVVVDRGDSSVKWLFWGAVLGAGIALLYAPRSGEETRRSLQKKVRKLRAATEEKLDEVVTTLKSGARNGARATPRVLDDEDQFDDDEDFDGAEADAPPPSARQELERQLAATRARRRTAGESGA